MTPQQSHEVWILDGRRKSMFRLTFHGCFLPFRGYIWAGENILWNFPLPGTQHDLIGDLFTWPGYYKRKEKRDIFRLHLSLFWSILISVLTSCYFIIYGGIFHLFRFISFFFSLPCYDKKEWKIIAVFGLSLSWKHLEDEVCNLSTTFLPKHSSFFPHIRIYSLDV